MGITAAATLAEGGRVHGVIPEALTDRERKWIDPKAIPVRFS